MSDKLEVSGALMQGFSQAGIKLKIITRIKLHSFFTDFNVDNWYPIKDWKALQEIVSKKYANSSPILEKVGIEMMNIWYHHVIGSKLVKSGVEFLYFQTSSNGYYSVVRGPSSKIGKFDLIELDEKNGTAIVHSTTPFNRDMERGILIGGMKAPGDLNYVDVNNDEHRDYFEIKFH
jgi:hypothetical protein